MGHKEVVNINESSDKVKAAAAVEASMKKRRFSMNRKKCLEGKNGLETNFEASLVFLLNLDRKKSTKSPTKT